MNERKLRIKIKSCLWVVLIGLVLSGITAFPLETELKYLSACVNGQNAMATWLHHTYYAVRITNQHFSSVSYGTDWLGFVHLLLALLFVGPLFNPVKNIWVIQFGIIACIAVFPLAFIAGYIRGIPFFWQLIDCSFGLLGIVPLVLCYVYIRKLEESNQAR